MGGLEKAKILLGENDDQMEVQFNPVSYAVGYPKQVSHMYMNLLGDGKIVSGVRDEARTLSLELIFYSYESAEEKSGLLAMVGEVIKDKLKTALGINNDSVQGNIDHLAEMTTISQGQEYNGLTFVWGTFIFHGVVLNMNVRYDLFYPNGEPAKAVVSLQMLETPDPADFSGVGLLQQIVRLVGGLAVSKLEDALPS